MIIKMVESAWEPNYICVVYWTFVDFKKGVVLIIKYYYYYKYSNAFITVLL